MPQTPLQIPPGLQRYPIRKRDLLQAWDSADELILQYLSGTLGSVPPGPDLTGQRLVILNDAFGALASSLESFQPSTYNDSFVSHQATAINSAGRLKTLHQLSDLTGHYDLAIIKIPKNMSFFEDELCHLTAHLRPGARVVCGAMVKHLAKSSFDLLAQYIGTTSTSLAQKKARLIFAAFEKSTASSPYPIQVPIESFTRPFVHHANLFSREKLDLGTRFFLQHIPRGQFARILDLGCGNGVVGLAALRLHPEAQVVFCDDSAQALLSAEANYKALHPGRESQAQWIWTNCFENQTADAFDLILCNPPFHQQSTVGDFVARQMFTDARHALRPGGQIRVIGNTHLDYPGTLRRLFGSVTVVAKNSKFTICDGIKT